MKRPGVLLLSAFAVAALTLGVANVASADLIQTREFGPNVPNFTETLTFDQHECPQGYTLTGIKVEMYLEISGGYLVVDNDGAEEATVVVQLGATGNLSSTDVTLLDDAFQPVVSDVEVFTSDMFVLGPDDGDGPGDVDPNPPDGATHLGGAGSDSDFGFINSAFWSGFQGTGTYDIDAEVDQILDFGGVGGVEGSYGPVTASGWVTVSMYCVPEPGTLSLLGLGGLLLIRRRRA